MGMYLTEKVYGIKDLPLPDRQLLILAGMAAALGGLFAAPMLSALMVFELSANVPK